MYGFADYKSHYEDCLKSLDLIKKIVKQEALKKLLPSPAIKELRQDLIHLFSHPELSKICKTCQGECCTTHNFSLTPFDLFCFVIDNHNFELPEPDWQFLKSELRRNKLLINNRCLFLSGRGCLLKECRPMVCLLFYNCDSSFKPDGLEAKLWQSFNKDALEKIFFQRTPFYGQAKEDFCLKLILASGIKKGSLLTIEIKGAISHAPVGSPVCLQTLESLLHACENKGENLGRS